LKKLFPWRIELKELVNKVSVVTGAGGGLGRELALACGRRGMKLVLADVDPANLAATVALIHQQLPATEIASLRVDVSQYEQVEALASLARDRFGGAHVLFNNAGVGVTAPIWENTVADWQWVTNVNLYGVAWGIKAFVPIMLEQSCGHIVNIASAAGWMYSAGSGIYNTTKAAVVAMSETLANDLSITGKDVGVSVVSPAYFPTGIASSERNRPSDLAETAKDSATKRLHEAHVRKMVEAGQISAAEIAESTLIGVEENRFYVFPHSWVPDAIAARSKTARVGKTAFNPQA
jgi:NAD(P)-dependent dehydrogenase (short-subunit alcohol dehydrogenase family)